MPLASFPPQQNFVGPRNFFFYVKNFFSFFYVMILKETEIFRLVPRCYACVPEGWSTLDKQQSSVMGLTFFSIPFPVLAGPGFSSASSVRAAITKYQRLGDLIHRNVFSHKIRGQHSQVLGGSLLLACRQPPPYCVLTRPLFCAKQRG